MTILGAMLSANAQQQPIAPSATTPAAAARAPASGAAAGDMSFRSAFEGYQSFSDEKAGSWREANDNVGRIGGWREYAKEAQGGGQGASPAAGQQQRPAAAPQGAASAPAARPPAPAGGASQPAAPPRPPASASGAGQGSHSGHGKH